MPSNRLRKTSNSLLALPLTGGAAIFTRNTPSAKPSTSFLGALGQTRSEILASFSKMYRVNLVSYYSSPLLAVLKAIEARKRTPLIISQNIQVNSGSSVGMTPPAVRPPKVAHTPARLPKTIAAVPI